MALEKELATFQRELPNLLPQVGKFALLHADQVASVWTSYEDAIQEGYRLFGLEPFLVKQIEPMEHVHYFARDILPICH